jgi:hypothetical protein
MAVTAIKEVRNEAASASVLITNVENPFAPGNTVELAGAGSSAQCDMWIPWCALRDEFAAGKYIKVEVRGPSMPANPAPVLITHLIWQAHHAEPGSRLGCLELPLAPFLWIGRLIFERFAYPYGDAVRTTTGTTYLAPAPVIAGAPQVGGDRRLWIRNDYVELEVI